MSRIRVAAAQPAHRTIDASTDAGAPFLAAVDLALDPLERLLHRAADAGCAAVAFPEDTLGLGPWLAEHDAEAADVLPVATARMLERFGAAAAARGIDVLCCSDAIAASGRTRNRAFFIGRDGGLVGTYDKVGMPFFEAVKETGEDFPVYRTPELGAVGMLICYDMVFPEGARCLALGGADVIFHLTLGGAAIGDDDISDAAFRTRAAENRVWIVVSWCGGGSRIIDPSGRVVARAEGVDTLAIAEIDPHGGRAGGDAWNHQEDVRARLFRERRPQAYARLCEERPPIIEALPEIPTAIEGAALARRTRAHGVADFEAAEALLVAGRTADAERAFRQLVGDYPGTWVERVARAALSRLPEPARG